jgi:hypothetical protein
MAISKLPPPLLKLLLLSSPQRNNETFDVLVPFKLRGASLSTALSTFRTHIPSSKPNIHKKLQKASEQAEKHKSSTEKQISIISKQKERKKERKITQEHCYCFAPDEEEEDGAG